MLQTTEVSKDELPLALPLPLASEVLLYLQPRRFDNVYLASCYVMFKMLYLTGCRVAELDRMRLSKLFPLSKGVNKEYLLYLELGKNQKHYRKVVLPALFVQELKEYRDFVKCYQDKLFSINHHTLRRYFNRDIRPQLSSAWRTKVLNPTHCKFKELYKYSLRGLRKTYQTFKFYTNKQKYGDPYLALLFTARDMHHSSERITAEHYVRHFDSLGITTKNTINYDTADLTQSSLLSFT